MANTAYFELLTQQDVNWGTGSVTKKNPGGGNLTATQVSIASLGVGQAKTTSSWDVGSIASASKASTTITVSGAALGDFCLVSSSLDVQDLVLDAQVTAANTVTVVLANNTGSALDIGTPTIAVLVLKSA